MMIYPRLQSQFFEHTQPSTQWCAQILQSKMRTFHAKLVPIYEWEGILFVAIPWDLDLHSNPFNIEGHWQIVQADPDRISAFWRQHFENISIATGKPPQRSPDPQAIERQALTPVAPAAPAAPATPEAPSPPPVFDFESPDNMFDSSPTEKPAPPTASGLELPEGLDFGVGPDANFEINVPPAPKLDVLDLDPPSPSESSGSSNPLDIAIESELEDTKEVSYPPPPPPPPPPTEERTRANSKHPKVDLYSDLALPSPYVSQLKLHLERNHLVLPDSNGKPTTIAIDLTLPSPFRIVYRTRKEYHGSVISCSALDRFFSEAFKAPAPKFMTIIPSIKSDRIESMQVFWANEDIQSLSHLNAIHSFIKSLHTSAEAA